MDDVISIASAIKLLEKWADGYDYIEIPTKDAIEEFMSLPSAQRKGKWIFGVDEETGERDLKAWTCSLCWGKYPWQPNFCPNCGAEMRPDNAPLADDDSIYG